MWQIHNASQTSQKQGVLQLHPLYIRHTPSTRVRSDLEKPRDVSRRSAKKKKKKKTEESVRREGDLRESLCDGNVRGA